MWTCPECGERHDDQYDSCWKCAGAAAPSPPTNPIRCPRCLTDLNFVGTRRFHEGPRYGMLGELGELFVNREGFDVYVCPRCGRVEFFVDAFGVTAHRRLGARLRISAPKS